MPVIAAFIELWERDLGEAKRRRTSMAALSGDQRLLRSAAHHLLTDFLIPNQFRGACHYVSFGLHHYLVATHGIVVPVQSGWARSPDIAWAMHSWLELGGRKTDLAIHFPNPPVLSGDLLIDGDLIARGQTSFAYSLDPDDSVPTVIEKSADEVSRGRRIAERERFQGLAEGGDLDAIKDYLSGAPDIYAALCQSWARFNPPG